MGRMASARAERNSLLLAARHLVRIPACMRRQTDELQHLVRAPPAFAAVMVAIGIGLFVMRTTSPWDGLEWQQPTWGSALGTAGHPGTLPVRIPAVLSEHSAPSTASQLIQLQSRSHHAIADRLAYA